MESANPIFLWLTPALITLFLYGVGQGLVKKWIEEVPPARFCLYFMAAKATVNLGFYFYNFFMDPVGHTPPLDPEARQAMLLGILAYLLDGTGWILYFLSIIAGPITIVGTLSAAYPALTVLLARWLLDEKLQNLQYAGVALVIMACLGLSYSPPDPDGKKTNKTWIPLALMALVLWASASTIVKYSYGLPGASEVNLTLFNTIGGFLTLGIYGYWKGREGANDFGEFKKSFAPMAMMAGGDLGVIVALKFGPASIVTPLTGAYPVVTLGFASLVLKERITPFQWVCIMLLLIGIILSPGFT